jgi:hypothetical protein
MNSLTWMRISAPAANVKYRTALMYVLSNTAILSLVSEKTIVNRGRVKICGNPSSVRYWYHEKPDTKAMIGSSTSKCCFKTTPVSFVFVVSISIYFLLNSVINK